MKMITFDSKKHMRINATPERVVQAAYALSVPQGMGMLHYRPGGLSPEQLKAVISKDAEDGCIASMDYVLGRAVKLNVYADKEGCFVYSGSWFDHEKEDLQKLKEIAEAP